MAFLADAGAWLSTSPDEQTVLTRAAALLVPDLASRAAIDIVRSPNAIEHYSIEVAEGAPDITRALETRTLDALPEPARAVIESGTGRLLPRAEGAPSVIAAPITGGGQTFGVITLFEPSEETSEYDQSDLALADDIGRLVATALGNARVLREAHHTEQRYRALVQTLDAIVWEATPDPMRFTFVSDYAETLLGYPVSKWLHDADFWTGIVHPEDRAWATAHAERCRREARDHEFEYRAVTSDGRVRWIRERVGVERDATGKAAVLRGLMIDITERKLALEYERAQAAADRVFATTTHLAEVPRELLRSLCETLDWDIGALWTIDEANTLRCTEFWRSPSLNAPRFESMVRAMTFDRGVGLPGLVWEQGTPTWVQDLASEMTFPRQEVAADEGIHSALGFPVSAEGRMLGVIEFISRENRAPDEEMLQLMGTIGGQTGQFVLRRLLEEQALFERAVLESQNEATIDGIAVVSREGRLVRFNSRFAELWSIPDDATPEEIDEYVFAQHADPEGARHDMIYLFRNPEETGRAEVALTDGRSFDRYSAPLRADDGTILGRAYYYRDITDRKRIESALADNSARLAFLAEASEMLSASLDYTKTMENLARLSVPYLADWCVVDIRDPSGTTRRVAMHHSDPKRLALARTVEAERPQGAVSTAARGPMKVMETGRSDFASDIPESWLDDAAGEDREYLELLKDIGFKSYMCVPLTARGEILGAITFVSAESGRRYRPEDLSLAEDLARRAALAVDNARLYSERAWVARTLQESLLPPHLPEIPGLDVGAVYFPAGRGLDVGGDFYDMFDTGRGEWAVLIGDACGKGADAAALTALARYTVRAAAMQARAPRRVLSLLNEAIMRQRGDDRFCTVAYLRVYPVRDGQRRVVVGCGGHPMPLVLRANGSIETAGEPGTVLGVFADARVTEQSVFLSPGDAIVLYTDGVTEARGPEGEFGEAGVRGVLATCKGTNAQHIASTLATAATNVAPHVRDDIAIVVLRFPTE